MAQSISVKELRKNLSDISSKSFAGEQFDVYRRSQLCFKIIPPYVKTDDMWETYIDFTDGGKKKGENIIDVLEVLEKMNTYERN
jgi:antitoxin (DNA-binding transcriptional repressor) of toxin-antitoxin stability system